MLRWNPFNRTFNLGILYVASICGAVVLGYNIGYFSHERDTKIDEQHPLCYDTRKEEAWVARKNGVMRCFMEGREFPHRSKGSYID